MDVIEWLQVHWVEILYVIVAVLAALFIGKLLAMAVRRALIERVSKPVADNIVKLIYYSLVVLAVVMALVSLGVDITGAVMAGGFAGIVIGFAAQASVSNVISGLFLLFEKPFKIGDFIHVGDIVGAVAEIGVLSTTIVTWDGVKVRIPSSELFNSSFKNYSASCVRLVRVGVQISYSASIDEAINAILSKLREQWYILEEPEPVVLAKEFASDGVTLEVRAWTPGSTWFILYSNLAKLVKDALDEAGIEIPFPQRVVWFASPLKVEEPGDLP